MNSSLEAREPEAVSEPSVLQQSKTQLALLGTLRDRHRNEIESLDTRQASEIDELRAHQATEEQVALASMMQLHQESAAYLASQQLHIEEFGVVSFLIECMQWSKLLTFTGQQLDNTA